MDDSHLCLWVASSDNFGLFSSSSFSWTFSPPSLPPPYSLVLWLALTGVFVRCSALHPHPPSRIDPLSFFSPSSILTPHALLGRRESSRVYGEQQQVCNTSDPPL
ncbi:hypothetical protein FRC19_003911 [Serendipita sp. 401]|nr:hypothetical protein FRC15_004639 [Serendipita sp. 397]KAG8778214.1 hypothetical protein FRC16_003903 [Serendipita sp. 398]KAG8828572.1 hypothetical protein FRC19_003911 [Serendipita sp. 401]KAG8852458.1 hypothetical protein FRC20_001494 [Serendipita sp. 405]KAG9058554.1 hypothetical protein FS842_007976 [Serendipita sp. 407]